ncbi:hypothetical protein B0J12DRAFT_705094 [Macrophomina phaseolina]|uniref:Uncharacterized protein n=1 Tax=Macrophomina phaseolina TaxID=35725 RepID=A0ABQ8FTC2_9PEZI|nr:hypothetical protein B0J12DRAFT_705094 [Macrophomina phaseolina]
MASNKRSVSDLSPHDPHEPKKIRKIFSNEQNPQLAIRRSPGSTPDSGKPSSVLNRQTSRPNPRSSSAGSRLPGSPAENVKGAPNTAVDQASRPPLRLNTASTPSHSSQSGGRVGDPKSEGRGDSVSVPPRRGPVPVAPMVASQATTVSAAPASTTVVSPVADRSIAPSTAGLYKLVRLFGEFSVHVVQKDRLAQRLQETPDNGTQASPLQAEHRNCSDETSRIERQLVATLEALTGTDQDLIELIRKVRAQEEGEASVTKLKTALSPSQVSASPPGVYAHDQLKTMVEQVVKSQLSSRLGSLKLSLSGDRTPKQPAIGQSSSNFSRGPGPNGQVHRQSDIAKLQDDMENFKKTVATSFASREKETNAKTAALEKENSALRRELAKLQEAVTKTSGLTSYAKEMSSFKTSVAHLERNKADQKSFNALTERMQSFSSAIGNVLPLTLAVAKLQTEVKTITEDLRPTKDASLPADPRRRIFLPQVPASDATNQVDKLQQGFDALTKRVEELPSLEKLLQEADISKVQKKVEALSKTIEDMPSPQKLLQLQVDVRSMQENSEAHAKLLERHDEDIERFERDLRADNTRINEINKDISDLIGDFRNLKSKVRRIDHDLEDLEKEAQHVSQANDNGSTKTDSLDGEVKAVAGQTKAFSREVENMKTFGGHASGRQFDIAKIENTVARHQADLEALKKFRATVDRNGMVLDALDSLKTAGVKHQKSTDAVVLRVDSLEGSVASIKETIKKLRDELSEYQMTPLPIKDEIQQRFDDLQDKQIILQNDIKSIKAGVNALEITSLQNCLTTLRLDMKAQSQAVHYLELTLQGPTLNPATENVAPEKAGLVQEVNEIKDAITVMNQTIRSQSNSHPTPPPPSAAIVSLEKVLAKMEREVTEVRKYADLLRIDFDGFEEAQAQQSERIEADITERFMNMVRAGSIQSNESARVHQAAKLVEPARTLEDLRHDLDQFRNEIRSEISQSATTRCACQNIGKELEEAVLSKLEPMVNEKLIGVNDHLARVSQSLEVLRTNYPAAYAEAVQDIVLFSQTQGKLSNFLPATVNAIRDLQSRFDNIQTREMAVYMLNALVPHINQQLAQQIANLVASPVRDLLAPFVVDQLRPYVDSKLNEIKQRIEGESHSNAEPVNRNQQLHEQQALHVKIEDLENKMTTQVNATEAIRKTFKEDNSLTNVRLARIDHEVQRALQVRANWNP